MMNFSIGRPHSAQTTFWGIPSLVPGKIKRLQWEGEWSAWRWSFMAGMKVLWATSSFQASNSKKHLRNISPFALAKMTDPWLTTTHPWSLLSKLSIVMISCMIGSSSTAFPCLTLESNILSSRSQKNHIRVSSCNVWLSFSATMAVLFLRTFSLGLLFPV